MMHVHGVLKYVIVVHVGSTKVKSFVQIPFLQRWCNLRYDKRDRCSCQIAFSYTAQGVCYCADYVRG
jgi:hypothetical protein